MTVNHVTVDSPTSAVANVTVAPGAAIGFRDVTVQTGGELASETVPGPFLVDGRAAGDRAADRREPARGRARIDRRRRAHGRRHGVRSGTSVASVTGTGVQVLSTTVSSPTSAVARLQIAADAPLGFRDLKVTTGVAGRRPARRLRGHAGAVRRRPAAGGAAEHAARTAARPSASFLKGKQGVRAKQGKLRLRGRASDTGCVAAISVAGRSRASRWRSPARRAAGAGSWPPSGKLTSARKCSKPVFLKAKGTTTWSLS